jgi:lysophospholipase L1-like esterase
VLLPALLAFLAAWMFQTWVLRLGNTLHANGRWESSKVGLDHGILGAVSFVTTRRALHADRLDLATWHGFHEILLRQALVPERLALRFRLPDGGWLVAVTAHDGARFEGVRLSRDAGFPSACLAGTAAGAFTRNEPLAAPALDPGWHDLALAREGPAFRVAVDGVPVGRCAATLAGPVRVGLRGSLANHVEVDDVRVESAAPPEVVEEDFANHRHALAWWLGGLSAIALLDGVVAAVTAPSRREGQASLAAALLATNGVALACAGLVLGVDTVWFARRYPSQVNFEGYENHIEYEGQIVPRLAREYPLGPPPPGVRRILVLGTSQTWGSGAARPEDVWVRRLEAALQREAAPGEGFQLIDGGLPGENAKELRKVYEKRWIQWQPELVLVDLGNNDRDAAELARELERIASLSAERGIRLAFVPEPNCIESRGPGSLAVLRANHAAMRQVAGRLGIPVVEVHDALVAEADTGFLWWDRVHLTSYGQERLAALLFDQRARWLTPSAAPPG